MSNYLRTDGIPRWSFNIGMGQNIFPGGLNDPFSIILYLIGPRGIPYAIAYVEVLKILTAGILFFLYLRTMKISNFVSIIGALCFSFSGYMIIGTEWYNFSTFFVYVAFILFAFEKFIMDNKWFLMPIAVIFMSTWLFMFFTFTLFFIAYIIVRYIEEFEWNLRDFIILSLKIAGFYILGMLMNSVIIVNGVIQMLDSPRVSGQAGYFNVLKATPVFGLGEKLHYLTAILRMYSNDLAGTGSDFRGWYNYLEAPVFYCGLITLLLIPQIFFIKLKKVRITYFIFYLIWILIIIFPHFRHSFNLFSGDYYKVSISFIMTLVMIILSAKALNNIMATGKLNINLLIVTLIALILLLYVPYSSILSNVIDKNLRTVILVFLLIYSALIYLIIKSKGSIFFRLFLLGLIIIELGYSGYIGTNKRMVESVKNLRSKTGYNDFTVDAIKYLKKIDNSFYRINKSYFSGTSIHSTINDAQIQNYYGTTSYMSFNNVYYINFLSETGIVHANNEIETRWSQGLLTRPLLQTFANIKYNLTKTGGNNFNLEGLGYEQIGIFGDVNVYKNNYYLPFGYTYKKYITLSDFRKLEDLQKEIALLRAFVVDDDKANNYSDFERFDILKDTTASYSIISYVNDVNELKQNTLEITKFTQNSFEGTIQLNQKKLLFFTIPYDWGWQLKIDGESKPLSIVNIGFMGTILSPGKHKIDLIYRQPYLAPMIIAAILGLLIYLLFVFQPRLNSFLQNNMKK